MLSLAIIASAVAAMALYGAVESRIRRYHRERRIRSIR